ncbi:MAG: amino acid permease [Planctomycetota bacterium]|nr:amino acid permease [Planctomycetota bacterium]
MTSGQLQRRLGLTSAVSITVGAVIGSGIFLKPLQVAQSLPSEGFIYLLWIGLGLVCLCGAFAYAELGAMFPEAGGQYAFLREAWGRLPAFLYGWTFFWIINAGTIAALAIAFADYFLPMFGIDMAAEKEHPHFKLLVASSMILLLALVNHFGVVLGALLQNITTIAKIGSLGLLVLGGVFLAGGGGGGGGGEAKVFTPDASAATTLTISGLVTAFLGIFWAYEGWYQLPFNAAELKDPQRSLPRGLILGMLILIVTYTAVNAMYLHKVPFMEMRSIPKGLDQRVPFLTVERVFSTGIANYLTLFVAISVFGSANPNFLSSPRAFYAMGKDRLVPAFLTRISPRWGTPVAAIWAQAACAVLIISVLQGFHDVTAFVVFAGFLFYGLTVAAVYRLRQLRPLQKRPYRCTGYPFTPALFILVAVGFVVALLTDPAEQKNALWGVSILASGVPAYWLLNRRGTAHT